MNNDHAAYRSRIECFDIVKPHVALTCVPPFKWIVLREDCLAHRTPFGPESDRCVPRVELQVKRDSLPALEPSDPGPMYFRKFRVLPFCSASVKSKFNIVVANDDFWNSYFHSPGSSRGPDNSRCLRGSSSTTCSDDSAEDCGMGVSIDVRHTDFSLGISKRERSLLVSVSGQELGFSRDRGVTSSRSSLASPNSLSNMHLAASIILWSVSRETSCFCRQLASAWALS